MEEKPNIIRMADVIEHEKEFLFNDIIPAGEVTILGGRGGSGKSICTCDMAAAISAGKPAFFENTEDFNGRNPSNVLMLNPEDAIESVIKPRLRRMEANMNNIYTLHEIDIKKAKIGSSFLEGVISDLRPKLLILDPLQEFIDPTVNMGSRNGMRDALAPLRELKHTYGCTILIVCHCNKRPGAVGVDRISDSPEIVDFARSACVFGKSQDGQRYIAHCKTNYGRHGQTILFDIDEVASVPIFKGFSDKKDEDFVAELNIYTKASPKLNDAEDFILNALEEGEMETRELDELATNSGFTASTTKRAKTELVKQGKIGQKSYGFGQSKVYVTFLK